MSNTVEDIQDVGFREIILQAREYVSTVGAIVADTALEMVMSYMIRHPTDKA